MNRLLNAVEEDERANLLNTTKENYGGSMPKHLEGIFYKDLLMELDATMLTNLLSYVETRKLALYLDQMFTPEQKSYIISQLPNVLSEKLNVPDKSLSAKKDAVIIRS